MCHQVLRRKERISCIPSGRATACQRLKESKGDVFSIGLRGKMPPVFMLIFNSKEILF